MAEESNNAKIIVICGPTGVGKTRFAIRLAQSFNGEIVGADSMQIYRHMDIGTAKPTSSEKAAVPHHLVDIIDPDQAFDAAGYAHQAMDCVSRLVRMQKVPFVVGGTGLYIKSLIYGLAEAAPSDTQVRQGLLKRLEKNGTAALHQRLAQADPDTAGRIHPNDSYRIIRALEVLEITGRSITAHHQAHGFVRPRYDALQIGLTLDRPMLYDRINRRVDAMLAEGFVSEVQSLLDQGFAPDLKAMQSLGYRHIVDYIQGRMQWDEAVRTMKRDHRRYAKRQMTWFQAVDAMNWVSPEQYDHAATLVADFLSNPS